MNFNSTRRAVIKGAVAPSLAIVGGTPQTLGLRKNIQPKFRSWLAGNFP